MIYNNVHWFWLAREKFHTYVLQRLCGSNKTNFGIWIYKRNAQTRATCADNAYLQVHRKYNWTEKKNDFCFWCDNLTLTSTLLLSTARLVITLWLFVYVCEYAAIFNFKVCTFQLICEQVNADAHSINTHKHKRKKLHSICVTILVCFFSLFWNVWYWNWSSIFILIYHISSQHLNAVLTDKTNRNKNKTIK